MVAAEGGLLWNTGLMTMNTQVGQVRVELEVFGKRALVLRVLICDDLVFVSVFKFPQFLVDNVSIEANAAGHAAQASTRFPFDAGVVFKETKWEIL